MLENETLTVWLLDHGANPNATQYSSIGPLCAAARASSPSVFAQLLEHGGTLKNSNALHHAIRRPKSSSNNYEMVKYLLDVGADIDATEHGMSPRRRAERDNPGRSTKSFYQL